MIKNLLYAIAFLLIIAWLIGFIAYSAGGGIHILLIAAFVFIILSFFLKKRN